MNNNYIHGVSDPNNPLELNKNINSNSNIEEPIQIIAYENNENKNYIEVGFPDFFNSNSNKDGKDSSLNNEKKSDFNIEIPKKDTTKEISGLIEKKEEEKNKNDFPSPYSFDEIKLEFLQKLDLFNEAKDKFKKSEKTEEILKKLSDEYLNQKQKRKEKKPRIKRVKKKLGRKRKEENYYSDINNINNEKVNDDDNNFDSRYSINNIIKKIKNKLFKELIYFINECLYLEFDSKKKQYYSKLVNNKYSKYQKIIKYLDSKKIVEDTKKENNIKLLNSTLKDIFSHNVSPKFSKMKSNEKIIKKILEKEKDNKFIQFIFNLTFNEWIDIFIYKKDLIEYDFLIKKKINKVFERCRIENILEKICHENDSEYFSCFLILTYNFQRWIITRKGRNTNNNKKES